MKIELRKQTSLVLTTLLAVLAVASASQPLSAANPEWRRALAYKGFSGGMMVHSGYVSAGEISVLTPAGTTTQPQAMRGLPMGIGGALRLHFGDHLRVGTEGYTSSLGYGDYGSAVSLGWGGLLVDVCNRWGRWEPFVGVTVGGGLVENLTLSTSPADDFVAEEGASYRNYATMLLAPFVGTEYAISERMGLVFKADYISPIGGSSHPDFPRGVRLYVGFMFKHF